MSVQASTDWDAVYRRRPEDIAAIRAAVSKSQYQLALERRRYIMQYMRGVDSLPGGAVKELGLEGLGVGYMNLWAVQLDVGDWRPLSPSSNGEYPPRLTPAAIPGARLEQTCEPNSQKPVRARASTRALTLFGWFCSRTTRDEVIDLTIADLRRLRREMKAKGAGELFIRMVLVWQVLRCISEVLVDPIARCVALIAPLLRLFR